MPILRKIFGIDLRTLALFRVLVGMLILSDLLARAQNLTAHYSDYGIFPRRMALNTTFSLHLLSGEPVFIAVLFLIAAIFAVFLIFGYKTRISAIISFILLLSVQNRNPQITQLSDNLLTLLLFWGIFLPMGAKFSVDSALNKTKSESNLYFSAASMGLLLQAMCVYFFGALAKQAPEWHNGLAVYQILHWESYAAPFAYWLRELPIWVTKSITYYVYYIELIGPFLMFSPIFQVPLRLLVITLYCILHLGFIFTLGIGLFPYVSFASFITFLPGKVWDWLEKLGRSQERAGVEIYYDKDCGFCFKTCLLFREFCLPESTPIRPAQDYPEYYATMQQYNSWVVKDYDDRKYVRWEAVVLVLERSIFFRPLSYLFEPLFMQKFGDWLYEKIAVNRPRLGTLSSRFLRFHEADYKTSRLTNIIIGILVVINLNWNVAGYLKNGFPPIFMPVIKYLNIPYWTMFTGFPPEPGHWYIIEGKLKNGAIVDAYNGSEERPSHIKPEYPYYNFEDYRWRKYLQHFHWKGSENEFGRYFCYKWNESHAPDKQLQRLDVTIGVEAYVPSDSRIISSQYRAFGYDCGAGKVD